MDHKQGETSLLIRYALLSHRYGCAHYADSTEYHPSVADILRLKGLLLSKLPVELIDRIIDEASYWASSSVYLEHPPTPRFCKDGKKEGCMVYLRSLPLGISGTEGSVSLVEDDFREGGAAWTKKLKVGCPEDSSLMASRPCRKIVFQLWCHNHLAAQYPRNFSDSYMWFDVIIEKLRSPVFAHDTVEWPAHFLFEEIHPTAVRPFPPSDKAFKKMVSITRSAEHHIISWDFRDSFNAASTSATEWNFFEDPTFDKDLARAASAAELVRNIQTGDCVALLARGRFPDPEHLHQKAKITVYWAV